jgi:hypothetical protein
MAVTVPGGTRGETTIGASPPVLSDGPNYLNRRDTYKSPASENEEYVLYDRLRKPLPL